MNCEQESDTYYISDIPKVCRPTTHCVHLAEGAKMKSQLVVWTVLVSSLLLHPQPSSAVLPFEPVQYLSAHLAAGSSSLGDFLAESNAEDVGSWVSTVKDTLKHHLTESNKSVVLMKGDYVLLQHRKKGLKMDTRFEVPPANILSVLSIALPILLEGYQSETIREPVSKVLKDSDSLETFLDLIAKLPGGKEDVVSGLTNNGKLSLEYIDALLGENAREVWQDAYMGMGVTSPAPYDGRPMRMTLEDLTQLALTVAHDTVAMSPAKDTEEFPLDEDKYLFGWWFNCPKATPTKCLIPYAPTDAIFSLSPDLRLYISPSLELTLIVRGLSGDTVPTLEGILTDDRDLWKELDPSLVPGTSQRFKEEDEF